MALMQGRRCLSLHLCDFSQSRFLINFQIVDVKVRVTPFQINQPHQHSVGGRRSAGFLWPYSKARLNAAALHVDLSAGGSGCPPGAPLQWEDGGMPAEVLDSRWDRISIVAQPNCGFGRLRHLKMGMWTTRMMINTVKYQQGLS